MYSANLNLNTTTNQNIKLTDTKAANQTLTKTSSIATPSAKAQEMLLQIATLKGRICVLNTKTSHGVTPGQGVLLMSSIILILGIVCGILALAVPSHFLILGIFFLVYSAIGIAGFASYAHMQYKTEELKKILQEMATENPKAALEVQAWLKDQINNLNTEILQITLDQNNTRASPLPTQKKLDMLVELLSLVTLES